MKYHLRGKNKTIVLTNDDFVEAGGEGKVYRYGDKVCKIYINTDHMIPEGKVVELGELTKPNIIKPEDILIDDSGKPVGITMKFASGYPLTEFFTNGFRSDNNISDTVIQDIVNIIINTITFIHNKKCLIVDGNELAYIVNKIFKEVFFIDVDSYQTPSFKPNAIHPNTRDIHSSTYSTLTDWFGAAIVICWLYVGVHPYKGKHPNYKKKGEEGMLERMRDNISIFNKGVKISSKSRGINCIPDNYKGWFIDLFEKGKRCPPPGLPGRVIITPVYTSKISGTNNFDIILLKEFSGEILSYRKIFGLNVVTTRKESNQESRYTNYINEKRLSTNETNKDILISKISTTPVFVHEDNGKFNFISSSNMGESYGYHFGSSKFILENTMYVKNGGDLISIDLMETKFGENSKINAAISNSWNVMPHSSTMMDGFLYQKALGKQFLYIPVPSKNQCMIVKIPELDGYRIISGKYDNKVCMLIGRKRSTYNKIILRFNDYFSIYDCRIIEDVDIDSINFVVLDSCVCASIEDNNTLELFRNVPNDSDLKSIQDPAIKSSMRLWKDGTRLSFSDGNKLYSIKMRK